MPPFVLLATVFITGACALDIEISGMRVLSPYFGNTIYTTTSVISVFLLALSFGYYYGGRIADKHPDVQKMYSIIYISGISVIAVKLAGEIVLPAFSAALSFSIRVSDEMLRNYGLLTDDYAPVDYLISKMMSG